MSETAARARELGELLRSRRGRLRPADVGLPEGSRRRTPGLRREEVAQLASISSTYYAFLEQGRDVRPSRQVLDGLCGALRLDPAERAHVHELVHGAAPTEAPAVTESLSAAVVTLVDRLEPCPAYVTGRYWDVLAANRPARVLWTDWAARPPETRNMLWWIFTDPAARQVLVDWEDSASALLGRFRAAAARHPGDPGYRALIERLRRESLEAREWWPRHEVRPLGSGTKRLRHPALGEVVFDHTVLQVADDPDQRLVTFQAPAHVLEKIAALTSRLPDVRR